ncbi:MAG TPA: hypothetical protein VLR94_05490 [Acidobacteriota bacterium]|nr:hypothetical protein [Acidobacteriota bacterium]
MESCRSLFRTSILTVVTLLIAIPFVWSDLGPAHKKRQARPIKLGTSGGNVNDHTSRFCCGGTLGALVKDAQGKKYILSNNHVLGMNNKAHVGDLVSQPANIDVGCFPKDTDTVATLTRFINIKYGAKANNKVDTSIAEIIPGKVDASGFIMDVKVPGQPQEAQVDMRVKKSGRTTGTRKGEIIAINLTVAVKIPNQCGSTGGKIARFVDQIGIEDAPGGTPTPFIDSGDSGSLLVQDVTNCPATIGLLFAGDDSGNATANRIQNVLSALGSGMKMVGCAPPPAQAAREDMDALTMANPLVIRAAAIQERYQDALMSIPGVVGVGIGVAKAGSRELALVVYTQRGTQAAVAPNILPERLDGMPVRKKVTGGFVAL